MKYFLTKSIYDVVTKEILVPAGVEICVTRHDRLLVGHFADTHFEVHFWQITAVQ